MKPSRTSPPRPSKRGRLPGRRGDPGNTIAFQGLPGAYSDLACRDVFPKLATLPTGTFEDTFAAVEKGRARLAMIPIENSVAGRVADIHHLIPRQKLHIIGEHFQRVEHHLLAVPGAKLSDLRIVRSHVHALSQCRNAIRKLGLTAIVHADTAGAAKEVAERGDKSVAAIASELSASIYGLKSLKAHMEDAAHNTTRFVILAREGRDPGRKAPTMTSFVFRVRNIPAALYKALGGFATNGVNMTKLESYMVNGSFVSAQFYAEVDGHPDALPVSLALEELRFYSDEVRILGVYPAHPFRKRSKSRQA